MWLVPLLQRLLLILYHKGRNNFSLVDKEENLLFKCFLQDHQTSVQVKLVSGPQGSQKHPQTIIHGKGKGSTRLTRVTRDGVVMAEKAEGLWEDTGWGKGGYTSVRADEMAGKINSLSGRRLFGSLS